MSTTQYTDDMIAAALAASRTPEGIAKMIRALARNEQSGAHVSIGASTVLGHIAERVDLLLAADDAYAALGRLTVEMYRCDPKHAGYNWPLLMVSAIAAMCTGEFNDDGVLQHPGETCPVCDAKVGEGQA